MFIQHTGTTTEVFDSFIENISSSIEQNPVIGYDTDRFSVFYRII